MSVLVLLLLTAAICQGQVFRKATFTGSLQTSFAETFQLTLGGTFGDGPAWQNKAVAGVTNAFRKSDSLTAFGWHTLDSRSGAFDWQAGFDYRYPLLRRRSHLLDGSLGYQRWVLGSVLNGTRDHLVAANITYNGKLKLPVTVTADSWRLVSSPYRLGSIVCLQGWTNHVLLRTDTARLVFRPGVATTYAWHFWNKSGHRVVRLSGTLAWEARTYAIEGGLRQQVALLAGIPDNHYWFIRFKRTL